MAFTLSSKYSWLFQNFRQRKMLFILNFFLRVFPSESCLLFSTKKLSPGNLVKRKKMKKKKTVEYGIDMTWSLFGK